MIAGRLKMPWGKIVKENLKLEVELYATGLRLAKFRMWLGAKIIRAATWIIGCGIEIRREMNTKEGLTRALNAIKCHAAENGVLEGELFSRYCSGSFAIDELLKNTEAYENKSFDEVFAMIKDHCIKNQIPPAEVLYSFDAGQAAASLYVSEMTPSDRWEIVKEGKMIDEENGKEVSFTESRTLLNIADFRRK